MNNRDRLSTLTVAYQAFRRCIQSVPDSLYLSPINGWSSRDVMAHLVGWNRRMIESGKDIFRGVVPSYYTDAPNDYKNVNAAFVSHYSSRDKASLLAELAASMAEFEAYVQGLEPSEWDANHGVVHYRGGPATVARLIDSLAGDYLDHTREILEWLAARGPQGS